MDHSPATPSTTPRHLKRLSLNTSSPFSPASPSSPLSKSTTSPANQFTGSPSPSPLVRNDSGRRSRSLRLSTSNAPASSSSSPISATSNTAIDNQPFSSPVSHDNVITGSCTLDSPTPRIRSTTTTPRSAHARRTSSISYSKSPTIGTLPSGGGGQAESTAFSPARGSPNLSHSLRGNSFESGRPRPSLDGLAESREEEEGEIEAHQEVGNENVRTSIEEAGKKAEEPINLASGSALGFVNAQATLTEQNADLLSFIAKKERKCLDLREGKLCTMFPWMSSRSI